MLLIDEVFLGDEDGEVVGDPLKIIVRMESDGDHLGLLPVEQLALGLDVVFSAPHFELRISGIDLVPVIHSRSFVPMEKY